ncbi:PA domain-containing protein [Frigoribacterium sp. RIT-PI-h]|uniref:PA domain-containing protein n=1 Tax=Frigoribacterium sp. RIT-PI-h TaxID=1690245 RepID=UPI003516004E
MAAAAGNGGPTAPTADNAAPWITTVAASTIPSYSATVQTADGTDYLGGSITVPTGTDGLTGDFVSSPAVAAAGAATTAVTLCAPDPPDPAKAAGTIVLCARGVYDRTAKSAEVERAGGIGMVLVNPTSSPVDLDEHAVPTAHLHADDYDAIHAHAATEGAAAPLLAGTPGACPRPPPRRSPASRRADRCPPTAATC